MGQYLPVLVMLLLGAGFAGSSLVMSRAVSPKRPSAAKAAPYECGIVPRDEPPERFPVRFYLVAMIFIVVDVEIIFLFPYAVIHQELGVFGLVEMIVFGVAVVASLLYMIANGALDWGPISQVRRPVAVDPGSPERTSRTTVRRVGAEGREAPADREVAA
ncbi:MAG: NAD(P)H-quinone oxidoreductase subunit 3 [Acidimicrobiales bacterium]|mgnify:CR=1 FL=1|nr:NAD(P)H-quinone oxidoreductase subunit 3 [Acidimicrobiales bacterium]